MLNKILFEIGISAEESRLYSLLLETGPIQVGKLAMRAGIARSSLYGLLSKLQERQLVSQSLKDGVKIFTAQDPATILFLFQQQIDNLKSAQEKYKTILPGLLEQDSAKLLTPRFQVYEGKEGLKNVLHDMLLYNSIETVALWPIKAMMETLTPEFFKFLNKERIKNQLYTRAIWPSNQVLDTIHNPYLGSGSGFFREIRVAPPTMKFSMGYWVYADKAAFLSSKKESFGFIIQSKELVDLLKSQFEILWQLSTKLQIDNDATQGFLKEVRESDH